MIDLPTEELDRLYEGSKNDRYIVVGSEIRQMIGMIRRSADRIEQLEAALRDYLMFLRKSVNVGPLTKNPSKEAAHLRRLIALIPDVDALAPEQDK